MNKLLSISLIALFAVTFAHGDIIAVMNLGEPGDGNFGVAPNGLYATSFTTGNLSGGYELTILGFLYGSTGSSSDNLTVSLYSSLSGVPDYSLASNVAAGGAAGDARSIDLSGTHLDANTEYFVVFSALVATDIQTTSSENETSGDVGLVGSGWEIGNGHYYKYSTNPWTEFDDNPAKIIVGVIPEPSVHLLILSGGGIVFVSHRWRALAKGKQEELS